MGKIISVCNQKGGTAKTTTAINLGTYLAVAGKKTLLIDTDPQGNATSGLGINKNEAPKSSYDILLGHSDVQSAVLDTQVVNFQIVASSQHLSGAEVELVGQEGREYKLNQALSIIKGNYDFILIDTPPSLGLLTVNALTASNSVLIPLQCEYYALEGLSQLLNTIELIKNSLNPLLEIEGLILTMADYRTKLTTEVIQEVRTHFKEKVYRTVIPRSVKPAEAPGHGKPIGLYDATSSGAMSYKELADEIMGVKHGEESIRQGIGSANSREVTA
ncbi:MAG: ParA family protein [Candidatus Omnitrophota bacterium]